MAEIKLPPLPKPVNYAFIEGNPHQGEYRSLSSKFDPNAAMYSPDQMRAYAEAAVLSANAGKVDAEATLKVIVAELINGYRCEDSEGRQVFRMPADFTTRIAKLNRPTQQAIDAGKV